jgi:CsoR family transcriptional regulator, copper-sensing transcriptional repressor
MPMHSVAVDPAIKEAALTRLRRIEGQIRGLQKMVEEERYCADIVTQVSSVQEALRAVSRLLLRNHLHHCATAAIRSEDPVAREAMYEELLALVDRGTR